MIQLIVSDLDETLLDKKRHVKEYTKGQIQRAIDHGIPFVCATGRNYADMQCILKEIDTYDKPNMYTISLNGGVVTENKGNRPLYVRPLDPKLAKEIFAFGLNLDVCIQVYTIDKVYAIRFNEDERQFLIGRTEVIEVDETSLDFLKGEPIIKILYERPDHAFLKNIEKQVPQSIKDQVDLSYSSGRYFEFNAKGINKGSGLEFLCEYLDIPVSNTMAIGDNFNDLSMLQVAGLGLAVKNVHPDMAHLVTVLDRTNDEDAVGHAIDEFVFNGD